MKLNTFFNVKQEKKKSFLKVSVISFSLVLSSCTFMPSPITDNERLTQSVKDLKQIFANQDPVNGPITLAEAIARAIKYNLDHRVKMMEKAVALGQIDVTKTELLPELTVRGGYHNRNNFSGGQSVGILDKQPSLRDSTSQERDRWTSRVQFSYNIIDFFLGYYRVRQQVNLFHISEEQRRKAIQNIIQDVRYAYWRASSADRLIGVIEKLTKKIRYALSQSRKAEGERVESPLQALNYQKSLLETLRQLGEIRRDLAFAKTELAALMNLKPGSDFDLAEKVGDYEFEAIETAIKNFERVALVKRPELREEDYRARIGEDEIEKAWVEMIPGIELNYSYNYDTNRFLFNQDWFQLAIEAALDVFALITGPEKIELAETQKTLADQRRMALSVAVLTQVRVAYLRYKMGLGEYRLAEEILSVDNKIYKTIKNQQENDAASLQRLIMTEANKLVGEMRRDKAYAELQNALGSLYFSTGLDPMPQFVKSHDLPELIKVIEEYNSQWGVQEEHLIRTANEIETQVKKINASIKKVEKKKETSAFEVKKNKNKPSKVNTSNTEDLHNNSLMKKFFRPIKELF